MMLAGSRAASRCDRPWPGLDESAAILMGPGTAAIAAHLLANFDEGGTQLDEALPDPGSHLLLARLDPLWGHALPAVANLGVRPEELEA